MVSTSRRIDGHYNYAMFIDCNYKYWSCSPVIITLKRHFDFGPRFVHFVFRIPSGEKMAFTSSEILFVSSLPHVGHMDGIAEGRGGGWWCTFPLSICLACAWVAKKGKRKGMMMVVLMVGEHKCNWGTLLHPLLVNRATSDECSPLVHHPPPLPPYPFHPTLVGKGPTASMGHSPFGRPLHSVSYLHCPLPALCPLSFLIKHCRFGLLHTDTNAHTHTDTNAQMQTRTQVQRANTKRKRKT